jgi:TDG/mug DNA glycosylase family protein
MPAVGRSPWLLDAGGGAGHHLEARRRRDARVVGLDASAAMLSLARPGRLTVLVRGDLGRLPFRRGALGGAWAARSYDHLARPLLPLALADLHDSLVVGAPFELEVFDGDEDPGPVVAEPLPGRSVAAWPPALLRDVVIGAGFDVDSLVVEAGHPTTAESSATRCADGGRIIVRARRAATLPDRVLPGMVLLVCGLNPSHYAAERGVPFARPGNRFWPALIAAGLASRPGEPSHALHHHGVGFTDLVKRATRRADDLSAAEYRAGAARLEQLVRWLQPAAVCFLGLSGYRLAVDPAATAGPLPGGFAGRPAYLMPNPSGLNAHTKPAGFAEHLRRAAALGRGEPAPHRA